MRGLRSYSAYQRESVEGRDSAVSPDCPVDPVIEHHYCPRPTRSSHLLETLYPKERNNKSDLCMDTVWNDIRTVKSKWLTFFPRTNSATNAFVLHSSVLFNPDLIIHLIYTHKAYNCEYMIYRCGFADLIRLLSPWFFSRQDFTVMTSQLTHAQLSWHCCIADFTQQVLF